MAESSYCGSKAKRTLLRTFRQRAPNLSPFAAYWPNTIDPDPEVLAHPGSPLLAIDTDEYALVKASERAIRAAGAREFGIGRCHRVCGSIP